MRARIGQVMRTEFTVLHAEDDLRTAVANFPPHEAGFVPVVDAEGNLVGIVEARDLLRPQPCGAEGSSIASPGGIFTLAELARADYVLATPDESVDQVHREMLHRNVENVVIVQSSGARKPIGIARSSDILALRRWVVEEEAGELRRRTLDEPAASLGVRLP
jgi:CBS domain-containing protein